MRERFSILKSPNQDHPDRRGTRIFGSKSAAEANVIESIDSGDVIIKEGYNLLSISFLETCIVVTIISRIAFEAWRESEELEDSLVCPQVIEQFLSHYVPLFLKLTMFLFQQTRMCANQLL